MSCGVASWLPAAVGETLCDEINKPALLVWLGNIRDHAEEYDVLPIAVPPPSPPSSPTANSAFDEILSQLGKEIYQLEEYQRSFNPATEEAGLSQSILELFEECLCEMTSDSVKSVVETNRIESESIMDCTLENECDSDQTSLSYKTSSPIKEVKINGVIKVSPPIPPPRVRLKPPSSASSIYDNIGFPKPILNGKPDSDSESTCWSYKECGDGSEKDVKEYAEVWSHSSGFSRSDDIIRKVVAQHQAKESRISFHTAGEWTPAPVSVYSLASVDSVADMTPQNLDDGYEPVRDALPDENIYEEIEYLSYTDEGCSCVGSLEVESCSVSASSESESPLYANLQDNDAYAIPADVIAWKNLLLHPLYNDDEEDEWITPEECAVYTREQRPPLVIPRITQYRPPRHERRPQNHVHCYPEENLQDAPAPLKSSVKPYERQDWSPNSDIERGFGKFYESPLYNRLNKKLGGSTENLLGNNKRPNQLNLPASSSGDSLDVEIRESKEPNRNRKSRSMVAAKQRVWSPVPAPRMLVPQPAEAAVICEGPVKRTKFWDKGKKCKKNWTECYMILTTTALVFYKDQKTYYATKIPKPPGTPPSPNAPRAELVLPLKSAHAVPCIEQHTRRYRRSINLTVDYDAYLLQDDTDEGSKQWLNRIQAVIYRLGPPTTEYLQIQSSNTDLESLGRTPPVSRHHTKKQKAGGSSNEDLSDTTEVSHVRSILRKFFTKRPAMEVLVKKGIYKDEPVFGRNLEEVCPNISPRVPDFVVACITEIEKDEENMTTDGLYRASGNLSQVQKIRLEIDQNNMSVIENYPDIHVLTGSLKLFFRELKEPLIPCKMFDRVLSACSIKPKEAKIKEFRDIVHSLPPCNRETLKYLLEHLLRVTTYSERNRMHTANLAIVFGPTLLWAPIEQAHNIAIDCIQQNNVVDILLTDFKEIFAEENAKGKKKS